MRFRPAVAEDLEALVAVQEQGAVAGLGHIFPQDQHPFPRATVLQRWASELADAGTEVYVCTDDEGRITGFAATRDGELLHFGTALHTWGSGLATELHDALLASFPHTVTCCRLRVFAENRRARRFYEKLGWTPTGEVTRSTFPPYAELIEYTRSRMDATQETAGG
jgi:RimJ/RimL family protein N-acetyltransferase